MAHFTYLQKNLFDMPHGYCFAHCISNDFALGAGIAKEFDERYNMKNRLKAHFNTDEVTQNYIGYALKIDNIYNLVTKDKCYQKPSYENLTKALKNLAQNIQYERITKLAMPKIGAGLDKLNWTIVLSIIKDVFKDIDIDVAICFLEDDPDYKETVGYDVKGINDLLGIKTKEDDGNEENYDYGEYDDTDEKLFI